MHPHSRWQIMSLELGLGSCVAKVSRSARRAIIRNVQDSDDSQSLYLPGIVKPSCRVARQLPRHHQRCHVDCSASFIPFPHSAAVVSPVRLPGCSLGKPLFNIFIPFLLSDSCHRPSHSRLCYTTANRLLSPNHAAVLRSRRLNNAR